MTTLYNSVIPVLSSTALPVASVSIPKVLTELYNENYRLMNKEDLLRKAVEVFRSISFQIVNVRPLKLPHVSREIVKNGIYNKEAVLLLHPFMMFMF